jgi:hypothetical protein
MLTGSDMLVMELVKVVRVVGRVWGRDWYEDMPCTQEHPVLERFNFRPPASPRIHGKFLPIR